MLLKKVNQTASADSGNFGKLDGRSAREVETARLGCLRWGEAKVVAFSRVLRRWGAGAQAEINYFGGLAGGGGGI